MPSNHTHSAILLVAFGTTHKAGREAYHSLEKTIRMQHPETEIRWAYTAGFVRKKLRGEGIAIDSPTEALAKLGEDGYKHVFIQSFHIIPGYEYDDLCKIASAFSNLPKSIENTVVSQPLLFDHEAITTTSQALHQLAEPYLHKDTIILWLGHGTPHPSNIYYSGLESYLQQHAPNHLVGTIEAFPDFEAVLQKIRNTSMKKIVLIPLLTVAGDHVMNDIDGEELHSWSLRLRNEGYEVKVVKKGLAEHNVIANIWLKRLCEMVKNSPI